MKRNKIKIIPFRRKREGKTDYKKRLKLLMGKQPRLIIRKTDKHIIAEIAEYNPNGDKIIVTVTSQALKKLGWNLSCKNIPAAYLVGLLAGKKAHERKIKNAIVDLGLNTPIRGSKIYAVVKGAIDSGLKINANEEIFPSSERISGKHIADYALKNPDAFPKNKDDSLKITELFENIKSKILNG